MSHVSRNVNKKAGLLDALDAAENEENSPEDTSNSEVISQLYFKMFLSKTC